MKYYEQLLSDLKLLNPGTKFLINRVFNKEKYSFLKEMISLLEKINEKEDEIKNLLKEQMREKTKEFKKRIADGEPVDNFLVDAFAMVREAARRTLNMRHFDVQILGGIVLHRGKIAEMATGEGKTLVATLPLFLNALSGKGCHLVTVNDYLAKRDTQWMGPIFHYLGLSVGCIISFKEAKGPYSASAFKFDPSYLPADSRFLYLSPVSRKESYMCDITYGVGSEFGFDYLRDNMAIRKEEQVQRELNYAIIDEVDSILIDEARTPLIISGPSEESPQLYYEIDRLVRKLVRDKDFIVDEENQAVALTEQGIKKCERLLGIANLYDGAHTEIVHHIGQALRAHTFFRRDKEYVVRDGKVIIVDEFTGRLMPGRRWSDGLHQAIEAKEGVRIESENQTLATISFQNYFKLYKKIAGMTGTAITEAIEFKEIYKLDVIVIPTNKPLRRTEYDDEIYRTEREKFNAIVEEIEQLYKIGRPVLVGTASIEKAEKLSRFLRRKNIPHKVLHGKNHEAEAAIIAQAGRPKSVTIATQMAGRGVDIILGGNPEILAREETIKIIWSKKASSKKKKPVKKEYLEIINEIDEEYRKKTEEIEKKYEEKLKELRTRISEKEKKFNEIDKIAREKLEREIFEKNIENFERYEKKLQKLKEKYEENNSRLIQLTEKYKDKPERLKEIKETTGKSYRDYIIFKNNIKGRYKISTGEDIEEKRNFLNEFIEKSGNTDEEKKRLKEILNTLVFTIENYLDLLEKTFLFITSLEEIEKAKKKIKTYLSFLKEFENKIEKKEELKEVLSTFLEKEVHYYHEVKKSFEKIEKKIFEKDFSEYIPLEREYTKLLSEYEKEQIKYSKELKKAREEYEKERSKYEEEWQKAREELEKSPEEFKEIFESLLEKYKRPWEEDHKKVVELGGLHVVGSERYEARRIDNQLKGRAGRQGDPGSSRFYLSLEDDLLRIFGSERLMGLMGKMPEGEKITHPLITKMINNAQKKVENRNFEIRKQLLEFDNVLNEQRNIIYSLRQDILEGKNIEDYIFEFISEIVEKNFEGFMPSNLKPFMWNLDGFKNIMKNTFGIEIHLPEKEDITNPVYWKEKVKEELKENLVSFYEEKKKQIGEFLPEIQRIIFLQVIDNRWKSHLRVIDELREGISLRAYAQRDPLIAYKHEAYQIFEEMLYSIKEEILSYLFKIQISEEVPVARMEKKRGREIYQHESLNQFEVISQSQQPVETPVSLQPPGNFPGPHSQQQGKPQPYVRGKKIGRNEPCPCGSGKKYKHCCGKNV